MKQILLSLMLLCSMGVSAQDVRITRQKKQTTQQNGNAGKQNGSAGKKTNSGKTSSSKTQSRPASVSPTLGTSTYTPYVKTYTANGVSFQMIEVRGGTFNMGATSEQSSDAYNDEKPVHKVTLSNYYIGKTEVTQALWTAVMGNNPSSFRGDNLPVESVSWNDCQTFVSKLNSITGKRFRLPTEAEWEFASRGGTKSRGYKYSGSSNIDAVAWYTSNSNGQTHPVATKQANELGIYDMSGNVYEWCGDWFGSYSSSSQTNPTGPYSGTFRVLRGGSWRNSCAGDCRSSNRGSYTPGDRYDFLGLRLCLSE